MSHVSLHLDNPDHPAGAPVGGVLLDLGDDDLHVLVLLLHHSPVPLSVRVKRLPHSGTRHGDFIHGLGLKRIFTQFSQPQS